MKELIIAEMKRAIEIMEKQDEVKRVREVEKTGYNGDPYIYKEPIKETVELMQLLKMIRKHTINLEKEVQKQSYY